jgi:Zn-dependent M16 (insulinase) family peptidase
MRLSRPISSSRIASSGVLRIANHGGLFVGRNGGTSLSHSSTSTSTGSSALAGFHRLTSMSKRGPKRTTLEEQGITTAGAKCAGGFVVDTIEYVKEFDVTLVRLKHEKTGAYYLHVDTDDTNNAFGITFRTPARESTGVAHILEHVVLCGSEKYPVRDPFFKMLKRSMNTYMNAMTAQDYTSYPFSTVVEQDFHNLLGVYLDSCFFPLIKETDFLQEGHRLELLPESDSIKRTGVVYNEMKGHLSDLSSLYSARLQEELFGDSVFGHNSGGDWKRIPTLTYKRLVDFHRSHYHPSNCLFISYGDLPVNRTLERVDELVLSRFSYDERFATESLKEISSKLRFPQKKEVEMVVPAENDADDKLKLSRAWVVSEFDCTDAYKSTVGRVLSSLLLDGPQAPVYASLIDAQIAPSFAPTTGFDVSNYFPVFSIGAQGCSDVAASEAAITQGLEKAYQEGFSASRIEAVIHQMELSVRHKRANFGLSCVYAASQQWAHGGPTALPKSFHVTNLIDELKKHSVSPDYWKGLLQNWVLEGWNNYQVRLLAAPSQTRSKDDLEAEETDLKKIQLTEKDKQQIKIQNENLAKERETPEDISLLPSLNVSKDVPLLSPEAIRVTVKQGKKSEREIQLVLEQKTNGITYLRSFFDFTAQTKSSNPPATATAEKVSHPVSIVEKMKSLLPMMCSTMGSVDAGKRNYRELDLALESSTGTLSISPSLPVWLGVEFTPKHKQGEMSEGVFVTLDCLTPNCQKAYEDILGDILIDSNFATDEGRRLQALLATSAQNWTTSLTSDASKFARRIARAPHGKAFALEELYHGYSQVKLIQKCSSLGLEGSQKLAKALSSLSGVVFKSSENECRASFVDGNGESIDPIDKFLAKFNVGKKKSPSIEELAQCLHDLASAGLNLPSINDEGIHKRATYLSLPVPVHYCSAVLKTDVHYGHVDDAALNVLAQLASYDYLHQHVREKGGAYGAGASFDSHGLFSLSSFWDPNSVKTLETFEQALKWLCDAKFSEKQVDEALLSIFGSLDAPQNPASKGIGFFLQGITSEMRDAQREKYFDLVGSTGISKLRDVAQKHLSIVESFVKIPSDEKSRLSVCVAGKQDTGSNVFSKLEGWHVIQS